MISDLEKEELLSKFKEISLTFSLIENNIKFLDERIDTVAMEVRKLEEALDALEKKCQMN